MKQKATTQDPLTKTGLKTELEAEIKKLEKRLDKKFDAVDERFDVIDKKFNVMDKKFDVMDKKFDAVDEKIYTVDEKNKKYKDEILNKLDKMMGEFETIREDRTIGAYQTSELREKVDDHEKRIASLEKAQQIA